jgi:hypothetical protein
MPAGMMAKLLGTTLPQLWLDVIDSPGMDFRICFGSFDDLNPQHEAVSTSETIVLDTTSVLTVALMKIEAEVRAPFKRLLIAGSVLAELESAIQQEAIDAKSQLPAHVPAGAKVQERLDLLKRAQKFALSLEILATPELVLESSGKLRDVYGRTGTASFLLAKQEHASLYSDDLPFRIVVRNEHGIKGFCTQTLLLRLTALHVITAEQYSFFISKLLAHGYWYILVNAYDFLRVFRAGDGKMTDSFKALSRGLSMPCTLERVVDVMVEFMENLWLRGIPFSVSDVFLAEMLDQICIAHKVSLVGPAVTSRLNEKFGQMPTVCGLLIYTVSCVLRDRDARQQP